MAYEQLIARLEAASEPTYSLFEDVYRTVFGPDFNNYGLHLKLLAGAWESAALALVREMLPMWLVLLDEHHGYWDARLLGPRGGADGKQTCADHAHPAIALLIAVLKAKAVPSVCLPSQSDGTVCEETTT